ncbi:MAG TPA: thermonuclease family protein [Lacipirellulaceae bacterium]|nr:thermonuclease family protein [Lacipirellulaceae bacterium]
MPRPTEVAPSNANSVRPYPRRYWYDHRGTALWLLGLCLVLWRAYSLAERSTTAPVQLAEGIHEVRRDVDGDTILLASGARIRLQGIDCPESVKPNWPIEPWGPEASQFTKDFLKRAHNQVRLTFSAERKDRYDRFLAFVWDGDVMLNEELVRIGLAHARTDWNYSLAMKRRFLAAQEEARQAGRGIWSKPGSEHGLPP